MEILHATQYAEYVADHASEKNLHKFGTRTGYSFFVNPFDDDDQLRRDTRRRDRN